MTPTSHRRSPSNRAKQRAAWQSPLALVVVLVIASAAAAILLTGGGDDEPPAAPGLAEHGPVEIEGPPLPVYAEVDQAIGATAPVLRGIGFDGSDVVFDHDGRSRVYGFFAHWCPHCQDEVPRIADWLSSNELPENVEVVAVSTAVEPTADNYPPSAWLTREGLTIPTLVDDLDGSAARAFGLTGFPFWVATDAEGTVIARAAGNLSTEQFAALVELAAGNP